MKLPDQPHPDWMGARVEAFLDADLPADEHAAFARVLDRDDADWEAELFLARQVRDGLRALPEPVCPLHVTEAVLARVRSDAHVPWTDRLHAWLQQQWMTLWQPALAMAVLVLVVMSAALIGRTPQPSPNRAEVELALAEVQWTLAYLSEVGRHTGRSVRHDVLAERVVSPVQDALSARQREHNESQR